MLHREIIAVCSEIHTKHINTLCGQNVELLSVKLAVHTAAQFVWNINVGFPYILRTSNTFKERNLLYLVEFPFLRPDRTSRPNTVPAQ